MRVIGGDLKGRRFNPPAKNWPTRPTTDISKEGLFNMLQNILDFEEMSFLDLFGGTGNHCYELISRSCKDVTYVDKHGPCVNFVKKISNEWDIAQYMTIVRSDVFKFLLQNKKSYDYIFAGPPYGLPVLDEIPDKVFNSPAAHETTLLVLEHNPNHNFEDHPFFLKKRNYGQTIFSFFSKESN